MRRAILTLGLSVLTLFSIPGEAATTVTVHVVNFDFTNTGIGGTHFDPIINVGDTIQWEWDNTHHSSQSVAGIAESWNSGIQSAGFTFDHTFTHAGDFSYYCVVHGSDNGNGTASGMSGIVHVVAPANTYTLTPLVSDLSGVAPHLDENLVNGWGLDKTPTGPWWVNSNGKGLSLLYDGSGNANPLIVTIPSPQGGTTPGTPSGIVYNSTTGFALTPGNPSLFLFATEDGTISGWNPNVNATNALIKVNESAVGAVYKGLTLGTISGKNVLYAANFFSGSIEVYSSTFTPVTLGASAFKDSAVPAGYGAFNIQNIGGALYVTWAKQDAMKHDDVPGPGNGYVTVFSANGTLIRRLAHGSFMNAPWGVSLAPSNFGALSGQLLVGQFGNGTIIGFDPTTGAAKGAMEGANGKVVTVPGIWGLSFGNGSGAGPTNTLYFAAGVAAEAHGVFGSLTAN
jgi:uncharacterized protein (TIGR03118 family)